MKAFVRKHTAIFVFSLSDLVFLALFLLFRVSSSFAEAFTATVGAACRFLLAKATGWLPFSLFELILYAAILYALFLIVLAFICLARKLMKKKKTRYAGKCFLAVFFVFSIVFPLFCLTLAPSYNRKSAAFLLGIDPEKADENAVFSAFEILLKESRLEAEKISVDENGVSFLPGDFSDRADLVKSAADDFGRAHDFYPANGAACKPLLISPLMTYTHLTGVYGFFTGEANVNTNFPDFVVLFTMAHESCHARGIAPENECNFLAFSLLFDSGDPYLRYSACLYVLNDFASACRKSDKERYNALLSDFLSPQVSRDLAAYADFMKPYEKSVAAKVASSVNDAYLKSNGQKEGTVSYSLFVQLIAAYLTQR